MGVRGYYNTRESKQKVAINSKISILKKLLIILAKNLNQFSITITLAVLSESNEKKEVLEKISKMFE
ncbi:MAG TPA: hypothetical protein VJU85_02485 [Nitrososphaeraceae archaeon]|nr:hypothetical protein [Nitrososphaeraceae archaeon]